MSLADLSDAEIAIVGECLCAAAKGPFFGEEEFHTLFGLERTEVADIVKAWPDVDDADDVVSLAINNAFVNLLGYPHHCESVWPEYISSSPEEVRRVFTKWRNDC